MDFSGFYDNYKIEFKVQDVIIEETKGTSIEESPDPFAEFGLKRTSLHELARRVPDMDRRRRAIAIESLQAKTSRASMYMRQLSLYIVTRQDGISGGDEVIPQALGIRAALERAVVQAEPSIVEICVAGVHFARDECDRYKEQSAFLWETGEADTKIAQLVDSTREATDDAIKLVLSAEPVDESRCNNLLRGFANSLNDHFENTGGAMKASVTAGIMHACHDYCKSYSREALAVLSEILQKELGDSFGTS